MRCSASYCYCWGAACLYSVLLLCVVCGLGVWVGRGRHIFVRDWSCFEGRVVSCGEVGGWWWWKQTTTKTQTLRCSVLLKVLFGFGDSDEAPRAGGQRAKQGLWAIKPPMSIRISCRRNAKTETQARRQATPLTP